MPAQDGLKDDPNPIGNFFASVEALMNSHRVSAD
jgi:hypothetical protein